MQKKEEGSWPVEKYEEMNVKNDTLLTDEQFLPAAQQLISDANDLIYISTFKAEITSKPRGRRLREFFNTLITSARQGVNVRFLINNTGVKRHIPLSNFSAIHELKKNEIDIRTPKHNRCCHAKIILVDNKTAIVGSHNLSIRSCHANFEISYQLHGIYPLAQLHATFEETWYTARKL